jgi:acylpyruvate hydrolase
MKMTLQKYENTEQLTVGKILCLGRNYAEHAREMKAEIPTTPVIFLKPPTAIIGPGEDICIPPISRSMHHEVELVVAIGKRGKQIARHDAYDYVLGYGVGLDMTLRDIQTEAKKRGEPWTVAKGFDTSAPLSVILPKEKIADPHDLQLRCTVNGVVRQEGSTRDMIFRIDHIVSYLSSLFTLEPGDLIFTGTPEGVGEVKHGDTVAAELVGHLSIRHAVRAL